MAKQPEDCLIPVPGGEPVAFLDAQGIVAAYNQAWQEHGCDMPDCVWAAGGESLPKRVERVLEAPELDGELQQVLKHEKRSCSFLPPGCLEARKLSEVVVTALPEEAAYQAVVVGRVEFPEQAEEAELPIQKAAWARKLFEESPVGIAVVDQQGRPRRVNPALGKMLGYEPSQLVGTSFTDFTHPEDDQKDQQLYRQLCRREIFDYQLRKRFVTQDGDVVWGHLRVVAMPLPGEGRLSQVAFVQNLTETQKARRRYQRLFRESRDAVYITNPGGDIIEVNPAAEKLFGRSRQELQNIHARDLYKNPERRAVFKKLIRKQGYVEDFEFQLKTPDGVRHCQESATARVNPQGQVTGYQGMIRDVTEEYQLRRELDARREKYEAILSDISDVVTILDFEGEIQYASPSVQHVLGYEPEELVGRDAFEMIHPEDQDRIAAEMAQAVDQKGGGSSIQYRFQHADGSWVWVESTGRVSGHPELGPIVATRDISQRRLAQQKYQAMYRTNPAAVGLATLEGEFVEINRAFSELFGYSATEVVGQTTGGLGIWAHPKQRQDVMRRLQREGTVKNEELQLRGKQDEIIDVLFAASRLELRGKPHILAVAHDIRERKKAEYELEHQALHDSLTDLPNRSLFHNRLEHAMGRRQRLDTEVAVIILDLDEFKAVNDGLGHPVGDQALCLVADRMRGAIRQEDTIARVGGDEFAVLLEDMEGAGDIEPAAERLQEAFEAPFRVAGTRFSLSVSMGAAHTGTGVEDPQELIRLADAAMYQSKQSHHHGLHVFDPQQDLEATQRLQRQEDLRRGLAAGEIVPYYQPIIELSTGKLWGLEPLARWEHPDRGIVGPAEFIPLAEEKGLIHKLGGQILHQACQDVNKWNQARDEGAPLNLSPNVSGRQFGREGFLDKLQECLEETNLRNEQLFLEVTESVLMQTPGLLEDIRQLGVRLVVDDFGTGYSSFQYLRDLDIDGLKIDMTFVHQLRQEPKNRAIVETMLTLGEQMDLHVTAEGIETREQHNLLMGMGCPLGQGDYFARPMNREDMTTYLQNYQS